MTANRRCRRVAGLALGLALTTALAADNGFDEAVAAIGAKAAQVRSYQADLSVNISMMGQTMVSTGRMVFRSPDLSYTEMETDVGAMKMKQIMVSDGKWMWVHQPAMNMIMKIDMARVAAETKGARPPGVANAGNTDLTKPLQMLDPATAKLLRTETLDGVQAYVFEGTPPQGVARMQGPFMPARVQVWVGVADGLTRKVAMLDKEGKEAMTQTFSNLVINKDYPDAQFRFTPPPGAQVMDMTEGTLNMLRQAAGAQERAPTPAK